MKKVSKYVLLISIFFFPSTVLAADLEITCHENEKPTISNTTGTLFDLMNFNPGDTSTKTLKVKNSDPSNNCRIYFKGEGNKNDLTDNIYIAFQDAFGNIVDTKATSNKNISDFLDSDKVKVADLNPLEEVEKLLILTFNPFADNELAGMKTNFDIRVVSEWGNELSDDEDIKGIEDQNVQEGYGIGGPDDETEVKGTQTCDTKIKLYGFVYLDRNGDSKRENSDKVLDQIALKIYSNTNGQQTTIADLKTNSDGYWEIYLCAGEYFVEVDKGSLPPNSELEENIRGVTLAQNSGDTNLDIAVADSRNFWEKYLPWVLLIITFLLTSGLFVTRERNRRRMGG